MVRIGLLARFAVAVAVLLASPAAFAAGIYLPENGAEVLGRGGADVGFLDTAYALQFNPAGLTMRDGLDVRVSVNLINPDESFKMSNTNINPNGITVHNSAGISPDPSVMVSYCPRILKPLFLSSEERGCMLGFGIGLWAPPGILNYSFPGPANLNNPSFSASTPQRYNVISQTSIVLLPSIGLGFRPIKWLSLGGTLEYVYANNQLTEDQEGLPSQLNPTDVNSVVNDVRAKLNVTSVPRVSGQFGAILQLFGDAENELEVTGDYQLYQPILAKGSLNLGLGSDLSNPNSFAIAVTDPNQATLNLNLPPVARAGLNYRWRAFHLSAEYVWEGWEVNKQFLLTTNAQLSSTVLPACTNGNSSLCVPSSIAPTAIVNDWRNTNGFRGGVGYDILRPQTSGGFHLQGNVGFAYDSNAIPYHDQTLPFITGNLYGISVGALLAYRGFGIAASFMGFVPQSITVTNSTQYRTSPALPDLTPQNIGNGTYTQSFWDFAVGLFYHWDQA